MDGVTKNLHDLTIMQPLKPHGFSGQRMVVVPSPVWRRVGSHPLLQGLRVTDAGFFPKASRHFVHRAEGIDKEVLIACLEGEGELTLGKDSFAVQPGDIVWLPASLSHSYSSRRTNPWTILWVHFTGTEMASWRHLIFQDPSSSICSILAEQIGDLHLDRIHAILEKGYALQNLIEAATALRFSLCTLSRLRDRPGATPPTRARVLATIAKLRDHSTHLHRLDELAAQAGVSISHYSTLFKKECGFSPIDFLRHQRIQHAAQLLVTSATTLAEISAMVGFEDPYYFSRSFRKIMGTSPRAYRKDFSLH